MPAPAPDPRAIGREVIDTCLAAGFALVGICPARPVDRHDAFRQWLREGQHGEMSWLADTADTRLDPARELPGVRSIIMVADLYHHADAPTPPPTSSAPSPSLPGRVARYAMGRDYHWLIKRRLHALNDALRPRYPQHHFRTFVDTAPVHERHHAQLAGLGWIGKHSLLIHPRAGSFLLLGGTLTTLDLTDPRAPESHAAPSASPIPIPDACGTCTRCIDACPTHAISPYRVDARRCIAYLTIEHTSDIDPALEPALGDWVFGCDVCQDVCPHNQPRAERPLPHTGLPKPHPDYAPHPARGRGFDLFDMLQWTQSQKLAALEGSAAKRADLAMLRRNAAIALANVAAGSPELRPAARAALERVAHDPTTPPLVRRAADRGLARLNPPQ